MSKILTLQIRLDETHKALLDQICQQENVTASAKVRELILIHCKLSEVEKMTLSKSVKTKNNSMPQYGQEKRRIFKVGEMYSGPGGIGVALSKTKLQGRGLEMSFEHVWASDYDSDTCRTYKNNLLKDIPNALSICSDIRDVNIKELPIVDGFLYGFPCNDFSALPSSRS